MATIEDRVIKCINCKKKIVTRNTQTKYCSRRCKSRTSCKSKKRGPFTLQCKVCNQIFTSITPKAMTCKGCRNLWKKDKERLQDIQDKRKVLQDLQSAITAYLECLLDEENKIKRCD